MKNMTEYLETAIECARLGARILTEQLSTKARRQVSNKQQFDFVTEVDLIVEKEIIACIRGRFPEHDILAEESGEKQRCSSLQWIIDPLDGTKNYIHGFPFFSVSIALRRDDQVVVGAIIDPIRNELFHAVKDGGAYLNGTPLSVSDTTEFNRALIATGFPFRAKELAEPYFQAFTAMFHEVSDLRRAGSAALDLAYVACGRLDGFWEIHLNLWDIAAGCLLVREAGGKISDIWGRQNHLATGHIVASNSTLHNHIIGQTKPVFQHLLP